MLPKPSQSLPPVILAFTAAILIAMILIARVPDPAALARDPDWGHQLAGAQQILGGEQPFIDFNATYGPLCFYCSALAQAVGGHRVVAEILLCLAGYGVGYGILYAITLQLGRSRVVALITVAAALGAGPRLYKYYLLLCPVLTAGCALAHLHQPGSRRLFAMLAGAATLTGLFRADFGAYATLAATVTVAIAAPEGIRKGLLRAALFLGLVAALATPWLLWVVLKGGLTNYFLCSTVESVRHSQGLTLPLPDATGASMPTAALFWFAPILPLYCIASALIGFRQNPLCVKSIVVVSLFALLGTSQAFHRSDLGHLVQAVPLHFPLLGWLAVSLYSLVCQRQFFLGATSFVVILTSVFSAGGAGLKIARPDFNAIQTGLRNINWLNARPEQVVAEALKRSPDDRYLAMLYTIRATSSPEDRLFTVSYSLGAYYFSGRLFGGNQMGLAPGYFTSAPREAALVRSLAAHPPRWVIDDPTFAFDGRPERSPRQFSPRVIAFVDGNYEKSHQFGQLTLLQWRGGPHPTDPAISALQPAPSRPSTNRQ
jgi:hypothetical protein